MTITAEQVKAAFAVLQVLAETIRELKRVPSGELYTNVMSTMSLQMYETAIERLIGTGLVKKENNVLVWVEPPAK